MTQTATRVEKRRLGAGWALESLVDWVATVIVILAIFSAVVAFISWRAFHWPAGIVAAQILLSGFISWLLFRCLAEHLRLQKKIAGLPYVGRITGPREEVVWGCSQCGHVLHSNLQCEVCGAQIVQPDETNT
jgi:uncharacterized integral membrane protein